MDNQERYLREFSSAQNEALEWLERETHLNTNHARMLCGPTVGALLRHIVLMLKPHRVLELGAFTGYSTICLASGLEDGSTMDTVELNDELEDIMREAMERAGVAGRISIHFGDAKEFLDCLAQDSEPYDLVFIDANKREYIAYYQGVIDHVRSGGYILADNVLWDGKVYSDNPPRDLQTQGIMSFNDLVAHDSRVENFILPLRDGLNIIRKK